MPIELINFKDATYPKFQSQGNAAQFAAPYAQQVCTGVGYDIGCGKEEWALSGATPVDLVLDDEWDALHLPDEKVDYIFSSHCLEHIGCWVDAMNYWYDKLKWGGVLFLYLPDYSQEYWRPWNNRKHLNMFSPQIIGDYMADRGYKNIFSSGVDLNNAFMIMGEK
jgi:predicted SAM-dependent methyltransferase